MKASIVVFALLSALTGIAHAESWHCELKEAPPNSSSFIYDILLADPMTARIEVSPSKLGAKPIDDAEAGTARMIVLQNSEDGIVLSGEASALRRTDVQFMAQLLC